jgi:hypothetical protein
MGCSLTHKSRWRPIFSQRLHFERSVVVPNHIFNAYNYQINKVLVFKFYLEGESKNKTRGSQEPVITHLVFNLTSKVDRKWGCYT